MTLTNCGGPGAAVPTVANQSDWVGDPILVSDGAGKVAFVQLAHKTGQGSTDFPAYVLVSVSTDGGQTFRSTQIVNSDSGDSCDSGGQDQPFATYDNGQIWIGWRHNGAGTFGGCLRQGAFNASGSITWNASGSHSISNMVREDLTWGQGGMLIQADTDPGTGITTVTVVYSTTDHEFNCPDNGVKGVGWQRVSTTDGGSTWSSSVQIYHTDTFRWCVVDGNGTTSPVLQNGLRDFGFAEDKATLDYYVAVNDAKGSIRLFRSTDHGGTWSQLTSYSGPSVSFPTLRSDADGHCCSRGILRLQRIR